jgi:hypothetical protein
MLCRGIWVGLAVKVGIVVLCGVVGFELVEDAGSWLSSAGWVWGSAIISSSQKCSSSVWLRQSRLKLSRVDEDLR